MLTDMKMIVVSFVNEEGTKKIEVSPMIAKLIIRRGLVYYKEKFYTIQDMDSDNWITLTNVATEILYL